MVRLGQNFLADPNLLDAIVREAELDPSAVVLEIGPGEGVLTSRLAGLTSHVHTVELDRSLEPALAEVGACENVTIHWADAMDMDFAALEPSPTAMVANLPYAVATPVLIKSIVQLSTLQRWTVMVQLEIADRLRAGPGTKLHGAPSVIVQWACRARLLRRVDRAVFRPRPRVDSALLGLWRTGPSPDPDEHAFIRDAFSHRRKSLARSVELRRPGSLAATRAALDLAGLAPDVRAEALSVAEFRRLTGILRGTGPTG